MTEPRMQDDPTFRAIMEKDGEIARLSGLVSKYASLYTQALGQNAAMIDRIRELEQAVLPPVAKEPLKAVEEVPPSE